MSKYNYEFLVNIIWYSVDANGQVGAFEGGKLPEAAQGFIERWESVNEEIYKLPQICGYRLLVDRQDYLNATWKGISRQSKERIADIVMPTREAILSELPKRGIYHFNGVISPYGVLPSKYRKVCEPQSPLRIDQIPLSAQQVANLVKSPFNFSEYEEIDASRW